MTKFTITIFGDESGQLVTDVKFDWDDKQGMSGVNVLGLAVGEAMADETVMTEMVKRVVKRIESESECQSIPTGKLH